MNHKKLLAVLFLATSLSACAGQSEREHSEYTIRNGIHVDNVQAYTCLDVGPAQVCVFRFEAWDDPIFVFSTDTDYRAWMGGVPVDF